MIICRQVQRLKNPFGGGCKKSPRPVNIDANHLLTQHHESAQPGAVCLLLHSRVFLCYK